MDSKPDFEEDLAAIRQLMERSVKVISFSGLSGILAGIYALAGAALANYFMLPSAEAGRYSIEDFLRPGQLVELLAIAAVVLLSSLLTGLWLTSKKARRLGVEMWDESGRRMIINLSIPLISGGIFILFLLARDYYGLLAPACLLFYGLALLNASQNLVDEMRYLGLSEIILSWIAMALPGYGLFFWAFGFGVLHILYGAILYRKYDA